MHDVSPASCEGSFLSSLVYPRVMKVHVAQACMQDSNEDGINELKSGPTILARPADWAVLSYLQG
jgi:hypothetical protein